MAQIKRIFCFSIMSLVLLTVALPGRAQVPFISQPLVPTATVPGGPAFTLTVNGAGFVSGSVVKWNGTALATTFVNSDQLTATVPAEDITSLGKGWITVSNPTPGGGTSNVAFCEIAAAGGEAVFSGNNYPVGTEQPVSEPESVAVGDFNGDGKLDLVTANYGSGTVTLLLGSGTNGVFFRPGSAPVSLYDPNVPTAWAVAGGGLQRRWKARRSGGNQHWREYPVGQWRRQLPNPSELSHHRRLTLGGRSGGPQQRRETGHSGSN